MLVMPTSGNLPIAIFLHELTRALITVISTFETLPILVFLYGRSLAHAISIRTLELTAVSKMDDNFTLYSASLEASLKHITRLFHEFTMPFLHIRFPATRIAVSIPPDISSLPIFLSFEKLALILVSVCITEYTDSGSFTLHIVAFIVITILELIDALSILNVIFPITYIGVAISVLECSLS